MAEFVAWCIFLVFVMKILIPIGIAANLTKKGFGADDDCDDGPSATPEECQEVADRWFAQGKSTREEYERFSKSFGTKFK